MTEARPFPRLRTARLELRMGETEADVAAAVSYFLENREHLAPWEPEKPDSFYTDVFWRARFSLSIEEFHSDRSLRLFLFLPSGEIAGTANLTQFVRGAFHACYLGYSLARRHERQGLMTEALGAVIDYAFGELNLHRVMANHVPSNARSAGVLRRLGFAQEGVARDYLWIDGRWQDHVLTSRVNPGWRVVGPG
jgi:ribosomal-protein-alanine N-acetyltransferase